MTMEYFVAFLTKLILVYLLIKIIQVSGFLDSLLTLVLSVLLYPHYLRNKSFKVQFRPLSGSLRILDLDLTPSALDTLDFPFVCQSATVELIEITVPWFWWCVGKCIEVEVSGLSFKGGYRKNPTYVSPEVHHLQLSARRAALRKSNLRTVEVVLWNEKPNRWITFGEMFWRQLKQTCLRRLLQEFHFHLHRLQLSLQTKNHQEPEKPGNASLEISLRTFELLCKEDEESYLTFSVESCLKGLNIDVKFRDGENGVRTSNVLRQWYCDSEVIWDHPDKVGHCEEVSINIDTNALLLTVSDKSINCIMAIILQSVEYYTFKPYRCHRPQEDIFQNPTEWWKHAGGSISQEIDRVCNTRRVVNQIETRRQIRKEYDRLYRRYRRIHTWRWLLVPFLGTKKSAINALKGIEENLSTLEIAEFRWWSWAKRKRNSKSGDLRRKLVEIYNLLSVEGTVVQANEIWRTKTILNCPKISINLALDENSELSLSLRTLKFSSVSGLSSESNYQTSQGPLELSLSCASFEVLHRNLGVGKDRDDKSKSKKHPEEEDHRHWLIRSPSPRQDDFAHQNFVSLKYEEPPLESLCPRKLKLDIAPLDLSYVERALLQMVTFSARMISICSQQGYYLEPLDLQMSIEEVVGVTNASLKQDAPLQQLSVKGNVGDVQLRIPCRDEHPYEFQEPLRARGLKRSRNIRRSKPSNMKVLYRQPVLVVVLGGFSVSTEMDEIEETIQNTISLEESITAREVFLQHPTLSKNSGMESVDEEVSIESGSSEKSSTDSEDLLPQSNANKMYVKKLSIGFSLQAFLGDPFYPGGTEIYRTIQLLREFKVQAIINSWIESTLIDEIKHVMKVQLHTSELEVFVCALTLCELSQLADNLKEVQKAVSDFCSIVFTPPDTSGSDYLRVESQPRSGGGNIGNLGGVSPFPNRQITSILELSIRIPVFTISLCQAFTFDDDVMDPKQRVGHLTVNMLEIMDLSDGKKRETNFVLRKLEVKLDNILSTTALEKTTPSSALELPFTIIKKMPSAVIPTFMTEKKVKLQTFQAWRRMVKRNRKKNEQNGKLYNQIQFTGRTIITKDSVFFTVSSTFLVLCVDNQVVDACVAYVQDLMKCSQPSGLDSTLKRPVESYPTEVDRNRSEIEQNRIVIDGDFGIGCLRVHCSIDGKKISTLSSTQLRGKVEYQNGEHQSQNVDVTVEDLILIDHLASSNLYKTILQGSPHADQDVVDDNSALTICWESSLVSQMQTCEASQHGPATAVLESIDENASVIPGQQMRSTDIMSSSLHLCFGGTQITLINRFMKDLERFLELAVWQYSKDPPTAASVEDSNPSSTSITVQFQDYHLVIPKCSWADEFFSITGQSVTIMLPASAEYVENLKDVLLSGNEGKKGQSFDAFWQDMLKTQDHPTCTFSPDLLFAELISERSPSQIFTQMGDTGLVCICLEQAKMDWGLRTAPQSTLHRLVLDGGNMMIIQDGMKTEIFCPDARCIMGDIQYSLIMDVISENFNEKGSFDQANVESKPQIGQPIPHPSTPPQSLGVNETEIATMEVRVHFNQCSFLCETPLSPHQYRSELAGMGSIHGEMSLSEPVLTYTVYNTGTSRVHIMAKGAAVTDLREIGDGLSIPVIVIDPSPNENIIHLTELSKTTRHRWNEVWNLMKPTKEAGEKLMVDTSVEETSPGSGIVFDYVIQQREKDCQSGPHVMEVVMLGTDLSYPYEKDLSFFLDISKVFDQYNNRLSCDPHPISPGPAEWMYMNFIMKSSRLRLPLSPSMMEVDYKSRRYTPLDHAGFEGFELCWDSTRVGYFWGGDGETHLKTNLRQFAINLQDYRGGSHASLFLRPMDGGVNIRWHSPQLQSRSETTSISCFWNELCFTFRTNQDALFRSLYQHFTRVLKMEDDKEEGQEKSQEAVRSSVTRCQIKGQSFKFLVEDVISPYRSEIILKAGLTDCQLSVRQDQKLKSVLSQTSGNFSGSLQLDYQNAALDALEPFIESWPFSCEFLDNGTRKSITLASTSRMNLLATPAVFQPLASVMKFGESCVSLDSMSKLSVSKYSTHLSPKKSMQEPSPTGKFKLVNKTGIFLMYAVDAESPSHGNKRFSVNPEASTYLDVNPVVKEVTLLPTNTKVRTQTISLIFAGNWDPIGNIVVDKVGKYGYFLRSLLNSSQVPVIVDVTVEDKTKIITVHSIYRIENRIDRKMKFVGNFISREDPGGRTVDPVNAKVTTSNIPSSGYLEPNQNTYLPLTSCPSVMLYLRVSGFKKAEEDIIRIEDSGKELINQQRLYTCLPFKEGTPAFHCCMEVQRTCLKASVSSGNQSEVQEYSMVFHPALTVQNLLPVTLSADLFTPLSEPNSSPSHDLMICDGELIPVYDFDLTKTIKLKAKIIGFETLTPADIYPSRKIKSHERGSSVMRTVRLHPTENRVMPGGHLFHLKTFKLNMKEQVIGPCGAKIIQILSPYWILNKTKKDIMVKERKTQLIPHLTARPVLTDNDWAPVLFTSSRTTAFIAVSTLSWSKGINMNSVGLKDSISVLALHEDEIPIEESEMILPHGVDRPRQAGILSSFVANHPQLSPSSTFVPVERSEEPSEHSVNDEEDEEIMVYEKKKMPKFSKLDFSISLHLGPGQFDLVKVLKISPRFVLFNNSDRKLQIGQLGTIKAMEIDSGEQMDYYWFDSEAQQEICVRPSHGYWCYSGGFRLDEVNDFGLRIRNSKKPGLFHILKVDVALKGDSMVCAICDDYQYPPYRIENNSSQATIHFVQKGASVKLTWETLEPNERRDYAWDYPLLSHRLRVKVSPKDRSSDDISKDYSLDTIRTYAPVVFRKKSMQGVRMRGNVELRDRSSGNKDYTTNRGDSLSPSKVFVSVLAEGPTRIIRFSDSDEIHDPNTNEEAFEILKTRSTQLNNEISDVYHKLDLFQQRCGIDMEMMFTSRHGASKSGFGHLMTRSMSEEQGAFGRTTTTLSVQDPVISSNPTLERETIHRSEDEEEMELAEQQSKAARKKYFFNSGSVRAFVRLMTCGVVHMNRKSTLRKIKIPTYEATTDLGQESSPENRPMSTSPFVRAQPAMEAMHGQPSTQTGEITTVHSGEETTTAVVPIGRLSSHGSVRRRATLARKESLKEKIEEWDDPNLAKLSERLTSKHRATAGTLTEDLPAENVDFTSSEVEEMIGGELLIKIHKARGLHKGNTNLGGNFHAASIVPQMKNRFIPLPSVPQVYVVLKCDTQQRRTLERPLSAKVTWDEVVSFSAVRVNSFVELILMERGFLKDTALGEYLLPLRTIDKHAQLDTTDPKTYTLHRSKGSDKVSGSIELSVGWKSTPLDRLTLQVKDLQHHLNELEEFLSVMKAKANPQEELELLTEVPPTYSEVSISRVPIGRLEVKIIEGRNFTISPDRLRHLHTASGVYGTLICERGEANKGVLYKTSTAKNRLTPYWNNSFEFNDVDLTSKLNIQFYDLRRMRADEFLGQIQIPVFNLKDKKPHYSWIALKPLPDQKDKSITGEVYLRLQWRDNLYGSLESQEDSGVSINIALAGFGISLIESSATKLPRELMHVLLDDLSYEYHSRGPDVSARLKLKSMQIDNQLVTSIHPVVFAHSRAFMDPSSDQSENEQKPMLEIRLEKLNANPELVHIRYFTLLLQEIDLVLEEDFLDLLASWFEDLPLDELRKDSSMRDLVSLRRNMPEIDRFLEKLIEVRDYGQEFSESRRLSSRWYIEVLHIQPIKMNITLLASPGLRLEETNNKRQRTAAALGINLLDLTNFPLKIHSMYIQNAFMRRPELLQQIIRHMKWQALYGVYKLLGTVELLGTPVQLGNSIMAGVASFFYEPAKGIVHGPEEFARGVATGTVHLIKNSMYGVFHTFGNVTEGVGKTLAKLSFDDAYFQRFQTRPRSTTDKMVEGARKLKMGCIQGITGIITDPYQGAYEAGLKGFSTGVVTGVVGIITKPASGVLSFAASMASGIGENIMEIGDKVTRSQKMRIRPPRDFGIHVGADATDAQMQVWKDTLLEIGANRFDAETVTDFVRQDNLVLIITNQHLVFLNFVKKRIHWVLCLQSLRTVESSGLDVNVCFAREHRHVEMFDYLTPWYTKKRITCKTKQMQQELLVKINTAIRERDLGRQGQLPRIEESVFLPSQESLRIMNTAPPKSAGFEISEENNGLPVIGSQQIDEFEDLQEISPATVSHEEEVLAAQYVGSTSGAPPIEKLRTLLKESRGIHMDRTSLQDMLIQFHDLAFTLLMNKDTGDPSEEVLVLIRDLSKSSLVSKMQDEVELVSILHAIQNLAQKLF